MRDFNPGAYAGRMKVLVLDEFKDMRVLISSVLEQRSRIVAFTAGTAEEAMEDMRVIEPDLVITDWNLDFIHWVRDPKTSPNPYIPLIMLTGHAELSQVVAARDAGVNEFLAKPISPSALHARIDAIVDSPRPFIRSATYFGPDRRRQNFGPPGGAKAERRQTSTEVVAGSGGDAWARRTSTEN